LEPNQLDSRYGSISRDDRTASSMLNLYSLRPKINAILGLSTQTNARCEMTKLPLVLYEKDLAIGLSFMLEASRISCLLWLVSQNCIFYGTNFES
jgi:hypothetical protein